MFDQRHLLAIPPSRTGHLERVFCYYEPLTGLAMAVLCNGFEATNDA